MPKSFGPRPVGTVPDKTGVEYGNPYYIRRKFDDGDVITYFNHADATDDGEIWARRAINVRYNPKPHAFSKWKVELKVTVWPDPDNSSDLVIRETCGYGSTRKEAFADLRRQLRHDLMVAEHLKDVLRV